MKRMILQVVATAVLAVGGVQAQMVPVAAQAGVPAGEGGAVAGTATASAATPGSDTDVLTFLNRDRIHGSLVSVDPAGFGLKWKSSALASPAAFSLAKLDRVRFGRKSVPDSNTPQCQIRLSNDDALRGELVAMEGNTVLLKTSYAGNVSLRRAMISQICPGKGLSGVIYDGPEDMNGWVIGSGGRMRGSWDVKDGCLVCMSPYPIGRELGELPDAAEIQFDVSTSGQYLQMNVGFCAENIQQFGGNMYSLQFSGNSGYLYRYSNNTGARTIGQAFVLDSGRGTPIRKAAIRIFVNRSKKQIALVLNGQLVRQWTDPDGFPGAGKGLLFQCQDGMQSRIGNIKVAAWDGRIPQGSETGDSVPSTDFMVLANGDKISGKVTSIKSGTVKFDTSYAPLDVPLDRITEIRFGKDDRQKARLNKNDIQCQFAGGGALTFDLVSLGNGQITGKSENFGDITLALSALEGIRFNPWLRPTGDPNEGALGGASEAPGEEVIIEE